MSMFKYRRSFKQPRSKYARIRKRWIGDRFRTRRAQRLNRGLLVKIRKSSGELKGLDTPLEIAAGTGVLSTLNTNVQIFPVNLIRPGNGSNNRVGRKCYLHSVRIYGSYEFRSAPATSTSDLLAGQLRMVVVWDKQPSGTLPTFDTIFGHTLQDGTEATSHLDPIRYDNMGRFSIVRDCVYSAVPKTITSGGSSNNTYILENFDEYIDLKRRTTVYSGESTPQTIADISSGALYVIFRANANVAASARFIIDGDSFARLRYTDG